MENGNLTRLSTGCCQMIVKWQQIETSNSYQTEFTLILNLKSRDSSHFASQSLGESVLRSILQGKLPISKMFESFQFFVLYQSIVIFFKCFLDKSFIILHCLKCQNADIQVRHITKLIVRVQGSTRIWYCSWDGV